jgi:hypothetical protein
VVAVLAEADVVDASAAESDGSPLVGCLEEPVDSELLCVGFDGVLVEEDDCVRSRIPLTLFRRRPAIPAGAVVVEPVGSCSFDVDSSSACVCEGVGEVGLS